MTARVPSDHEQAIIEAYLAGGTTKEVGSRFGYSGVTVSAILKRYGIKARTNSETHRKFVINENLFDAIDAEEKAYWLGFLSADGTIKHNRIMLGLQGREEQHLHKFRKSLEANQPITIRQTKFKNKVYAFSSIRVESLHMVGSLKRLGVGERKSLIIEPCTQIPDHLLCHYWRGLVDGDGSIIIDQKHKKWIVTLAGTHAMTSGFVNFVSQYVSSRATPRPHGRIFTIIYGGNELPKAILSVLYDDCTIYLDRKKALADHILGDRQLDLATVDGSQETSL